jgi:hypothetical protein
LGLKHDSLYGEGIEKNDSAVNENEEIATELNKGK